MQILYNDEVKNANSCVGQHLNKNATSTSLISTVKNITIIKLKSPWAMSVKK